MKPIYCTICFIMLALLSFTVPAVSAGSDIDDFRSCSQCGMDRKAYGYSRMIVNYKDGSTAGVCSLHCAVTDVDADKKRDVASMMVADRDTRVLINAEKAVWVLGGRKRGVMTQRAKWAFATQEAAQSFVDSNGGRIITWDAALQAAREDAAPAGSDRKR